MKFNKLSNKAINSFMIVGLLLGAIFGFSGTTRASATPSLTSSSQFNRNLPESATGLYIVQLKDPSVALYAGGISGLKATSPHATGVRRLDPNSTASQAYLSYVNTEQQALLSSMQAAFGHPIDVQFYYQYTLNAVAVRISHAEALQAFDLPGVKTVYSDKYNQLDTDMGPTLIGAPNIWDGNTVGGGATEGEGIVVGMIDSGINHLHPSFAAVGPKDGYVHINPYGAGVFHGYCVGVPSFCNNKLIAAYDLYPGGSGGPEDTAGHGSHTSSTAAGNHLDATFTVGINQFTRTISGVAPHANLVAYKVCNPSCPDTSSVAAVNLAIGQDHVDVINYSISGGDTPWTDSVDQAFLDAFAAGIFVSASAGNSGPTSGTVAHTGPWNSSVAASTHSRVIANTLDISAADGNLTGIAAVPGDVVSIPTDITAPILYAGDVNPANVLACSGFPAGSFTGKIGLALRGTCNFSVKIANLATAGAVGVVIFNNAGGPPSVMNSIPVSPASVMISNTDGAAVVALISGDATAQATIHAASQVIIDPAWEDIMAGFSSRGPSQYELLKPDYTAPGVNILAANMAIGGNPTQYAFMQGTSMSSPHSAGSAALMMALRPSWTIAEIRSAMDSTANPTPVKDSSGTSPANPLEMGTGRLSLGAAGMAGLVLDETAVDYEAANPATGGDPKTLNQPSMVNYACPNTCSWTRHVTSVLPAEDTWTITMSGDTGLVVTVSPTSLTLSPGETAPITITANVTTATPGDTLFGMVTLTPTGGAASRLPVVVTALAFASISVNPAEIVSIQYQSVITEPLTISNSGNSNLTWTAFDGVPTISWSDNFDSYATGSQMHGKGGWKGWANSLPAGALTSNVQSHSSPNSVAVLGASDLVHEYTGSTSGKWIYSAWQYIPINYTGQSYFIMLNTYNDAQVGLNWSVQVYFNDATNQVINYGASGGTLPLIRGSWVELRTVIDLDRDIQYFYYNNKLLYSATWTTEQGPGGVRNIGAVDLFANNASVVYYDDISLSRIVDAPWLSENPTSGTTAPGTSSQVTLSLNAIALSSGEYHATLYVASNDKTNPLLSIPVTMDVIAPFSIFLPITEK